MGRTFYVVLEGLAGVLVPDKETKGMKEVNVMSAGQSFGELSLLTEQPRNATVY
jgi:CRP-like cAMP-binding protein